MTDPPAPITQVGTSVQIQGDALALMYRATLALIARRSRDGLAARRPGGTVHRLRQWYGSTLVRDGADLRTAHRSRSCSGWRAATGFSPANFFSAESIPDMPKNHRA